VHALGQLALDPSRRELRYGDNEGIALTPLESRLLGYLMMNPGQILTIETLINHVWGAEGGDRDMLRQLVRRLRGKIAQVVAASGSASTQVPFIETVPGLGYGLIVGE
jgi:DNA-binding response OmpR family regulator